MLPLNVMSYIHFWLNVFRNYLNDFTITKSYDFHLFTLSRDGPSTVGVTRDVSANRQRWLG